MNEKNDRVLRSRERTSYYIIFLIIIILIFLRYKLTSNLPALIRAEMIHDDGWVVSRAYYLLSGQWMGPYNQYTLIKGVFAPLLLAFSHTVGISFQDINTLLYCFSSLVFFLSIKPAINKKGLLLICFAIVLFNPIPYALETGQRIYRNGLSQWLVLLIFSCLISIFLRRNYIWKRLLPWAVLGGFAMGAFFQTREDGAWLYPFIVVAMIVTIITYYIEKRSVNMKIALFVLPLALALLINGAVVIKNYSYYGAPVANDRSGGNYAKVMKDLYLMTPDEDVDKIYQSEAYEKQYYNIYVSTVEKAFCVSPTLESASEPILRAIAIWDSWIEPVDGQPFADHILFAIRDGVYEAGFYRDLSETEAFYRQIHEELQFSFKTGEIEKRGISISALMAPLQEGDIKKALIILPKAVNYIVHFSEVSCETIPASGSSEQIELFKEISGQAKKESYENTFVSVSRANMVIKIYKRITPMLNVLGMLFYIYITYMLVLKKNRHHLNNSILPIWLLLTGLIFSLLLFVLAMSLMVATTFNTMRYLYLSSAYVMDLMFCSVAIFGAMDILIDRRRH